MTSAVRQALIASLQATLDLLRAEEEPVATPRRKASRATVPTVTAPTDEAAHQRRLKADRQRRWRAKKMAGASTKTAESSTLASTEASTPAAETSTPASTLTSASASRTHARSFSSEIQNSEKNQNPQSPPVGGGVLFDVTAATGAAAPGDARQSPPVASGAPIAALPVASGGAGVARRRRADRQAVVDPASVEQPVREVWEAYREAVGDRVVLTVARLELIRARLAGWTIVELTDCVKGYGASRFHQGENDRGRRYVDLELWFRDASHIESGKRMWVDRGRAKPAGSGAGSAGSAGGSATRSPTAPLPLNGIEAKWDKWFQDNPEGEYRFPRVGSASAEGAGR